MWVNDETLFSEENEKVKSQILETRNSTDVKFTQGSTAELPIRPTSNQLVEPSLSTCRNDPISGGATLDTETYLHTPFESALTSKLVDPETHANSSIIIEQESSQKTSILQTGGAEKSTHENSVSF